MTRAIAEYHDFLAYVILYAPDNFPEEDYLQPHEQMTLQKAFSELLEKLPALKPRVKDDQKMKVLREMLTMSIEAYQQKKEIKGAHILQEFEGLIWPSLKRPEEYTPEAERRVFGNTNRA